MNTPTKQRAQTDAPFEFEDLIEMAGDSFKNKLKAIIGGDDALLRLCNENCVEFERVAYCFAGVYREQLAQLRRNRQ